ncbi:SNF2 family N-terminal domain-containing protein [Lyophyllum atratum]|nr:SNF2 family N-terminal domain-containing protein [Lyophyllum atratum]
MRTSFSHHTESLRSSVSNVWRLHEPATFRPWLNIRAVHELVQIATSNDTPSPPLSSKGKGRKRSPSPPSRRVRTAKRAKTSEGSTPAGSGSATPSSTEPGDYDWPLLKYPDLAYPVHDTKLSEDVKSVPVLQHTFEVEYTQIGEEVPGWNVEEDNLTEMVADLQHPDEPRTIDLGDVDLIEYRGRLVVLSPMLRNRVPWTLLLPLHGDSIDLEWHDISSELVRDPTMAAYILQSSSRTSIHTRLTLLILPPLPHPQDPTSPSLPFRLQIHTTTSLLLPGIFAPFPRPAKKQKTSTVEDAQRRLLHFLYPSSLPTPESYAGATNIPFFYSVLGPAPALRSPEMQEMMQPAELIPTLLPFQRRSVAWLLSREGKTITPNGQVIPIPSTSPSSPPPFSFWEKIHAAPTLYMHRLSGMLSPTLPASETEGVGRALGGILAEEPGLGKTLESIALILMNPSPPERNPSVVRWDPGAGLDVRAVKTTLIVTPPALAGQWVDELGVHAPGLRVMVYEGWAKVPVPVTKRQVEAARVERMSKKGKRKAKARRKAWEEEGDSDLDSSSSAREKEEEEKEEEKEEEQEIMDWPTYAHTFDVVITTYSVLRSDFNVALAAPTRPRREDVVYSSVERTRSPLVMVEWGRVIMDEVQVVGGGKTEDMVSLIPRLSSFAVSGTPARQQVADLMHVLKFLRVDHQIGSPRLWTRLTSTGFGAAYFAGMFGAYGIRTLKKNVQEELTIPQQTRYLVGIGLGAVEKHVYDQTLEQALQDLGLDARGIAASDGWQIDGATLRAAIRRLRAMCTHPQVGMLQGGGGREGGKGGMYRAGRVQSIGDVLQNMRDGNWRDMMDDHRAKVHALIRIAQLQARDENDAGRFEHALGTLVVAEREAEALVDEARGALERYVAGRRHKRVRSGAEELGGVQVAEKGKGKELEGETEEEEEEFEDDSDEEEVDLNLGRGRGKGEKGEGEGNKRGALQNRLRECRIALHRARFLMGDVYHALGAPEEDKAYAAAEEIRRGLLKGTEEEATRAMALLTQDATRKHISREALVVGVPLLDDAVLTSIAETYEPTEVEWKAKPQPHKVTVFKRLSAEIDLIEEAHVIMEDVLNDQSTLLWEWRTYMTTLLTQKLAGAGDEENGDAPDGEEYQRTLDSQGEAEAYLQAYSALLSDRRQALLNERTLLAAHDVREKKLRHTKAAMAAAAGLLERGGGGGGGEDGEGEVMMEVVEDVEVKPEHEVLHAQLSGRRKELLRRLGGRAIKSVLVDLNTAATRIHRDTDPEKVALKEAVAGLRQLMTDQTALMDKLDVDLVLIRKAFNQRILYFRQLQEISDTVAEVEWEGPVVEALLQSTLEKNDLDAEINKSRARQRYLDNLTKNKDAGIRDEDEESCILCRCEFVRGFITQCAHVFCEGCMKAWLLRREGKTCPVCRVPIDPDTIERFTVTPDQPEAVKEAQKAVQGEPAPRSRRQIAYNMIDTKLFQDINSMESFGDYGSKIQTLVRHLLYLKITDPGAKSIVFSAWADSLHIMERALKTNGIRCLRIDQKSKGESAAKRFKNDPEILVLLLHGERENAGLNITCASRVFLLESVVHHGFEIQAIARIDRMGQTRPTEVYCYYAEDTVERNILDLAARQGLSLYTKENSAGTLNVTSLAVESDAKVVDSPRKKKVQKGDFIFKMDDMLAILFPHMYEELEYLIPPEDAEMESPTASQSLALTSAAFHAVQNGVEYADNAVAGPSRLLSDI